MLRQSSRLLAKHMQNNGRIDPTLVKQFSNKDFEVKHDPKAKEFYIKLNDDKAVIEYETVNNHIYDLQHTEVPESFKGKGVAKILAEAAFQHVVKNNLKMKVSCEYLQDYLTKNPNPEYLNSIVD